MRLIATDDAAAVFEDDEVAAVATWEPMLSEIVANTSRTGAHILVSSADFNGLITDVVIVNKQDYAAHRAKYETLMRGIYRAVDLYNNDPDKFLAVAAPVYDVTPDVMAGDLGGVYYTTYEDALEYFGVGGQTAALGGVLAVHLKRWRTLGLLVARHVGEAGIEEVMRFRRQHLQRALGRRRRLGSGIAGERYPFVRRRDGRAGRRALAPSRSL